MALNAEVVSKALMPFTKIEKNEEAKKINVDFGAVAKSMIGEISGQAETEDPESSVSFLINKVDGVEKFLDSIEIDDSGNAYVLDTDFDQETVEKFMGIEKDGGDPEEQSEDPETAETDDTDDTEKSESSEEESTPTAEEQPAEGATTPDGDHEKGNADEPADDVEKNDDSDDELWAADLSPKSIPADSRQNLLRKSEIAVPARRGAHSEIMKGYDDRRRKALDRKARVEDRRREREEASSD